MQWVSGASPSAAVCAMDAVDVGAVGNPVLKHGCSGNGIHQNDEGEHETNIRSNFHIRYQPIFRKTFLKFTKSREKIFTVPARVPFLPYVSSHLLRKKSGHRCLSVKYGSLRKKCS